MRHETFGEWRAEERGKVGSLGLPDLTGSGCLDKDCFFNSLTKTAKKKTSQISLSLYSQSLDVIQIINKNQPQKTGSHPLLLLPAYLLGWGNRSGVGGREQPMPL
jgi:hypothetical protein